MFLKSIAAGAVMFAATISAADAAVITKTYEFKDTTFASETDLVGTTVTTSFDITFDPDVSSSNTAAMLSNYQTTGGDVYANPLLEYTFSPGTTQTFITPGGGMISIPAMARRVLTIYGATSGRLLLNNTNDFETNFELRSNGDITYAGTRTSKVGGVVRGVRTSARVGLSPVVTPPAVSAVPEPTTWAMMLLGFGIVGATARYRRRRTALRYA